MPTIIAVPIRLYRTGSHPSIDDIKYSPDPIEIVAIEIPNNFLGLIVIIYLLRLQLHHHSVL